MSVHANNSFFIQITETHSVQKKTKYLVLQMQRSYLQQNAFTNN